MERKKDSADFKQSCSRKELLKRWGARIAKCAPIYQEVIWHNFFLNRCPATLKRMYCITLVHGKSDVGHVRNLRHLLRRSRIRCYEVTLK
jgi:hypothetical protein